MIISLNRFKFLVSLNQNKFRQEHQQVVVHGERVILHCQQANINPIEFYIGPDITPVQQQLIPAGATVYQLTTHQMHKITGTKTPQAIAALFNTVAPKPTSLNRVVYLDRVNDPGNMGAILRSAAASGYDAVLLSEGCCHPFNTKAVRASAGAAFTLPHILNATIDDLQGLPLLVTAVEDGANLYNFTPPSKFALVIGSEGHGVSQQLLDMASYRLTIPLHGGVESLNAAVAAGICLFTLVNK